MSNLQQSEERWFVLKVAPNHEVSVRQHLEAKGFESAVPTYKVRRRWSDRIKTVTLPLFPGYVMCRFAIDRRAPVLNTPGVRGAITFGSQLAALEDHELERIHLLASSGLGLEPMAGLRVGSQVNIIDGPLNGMRGVLVHMNGSARLVVNVELLNRSVSVHVDSGAIALVDELPLRIPA